ncbi:MAG TPA: PKD domain-containing protein [Solirubrobacteraceae bacterium]|nr:PKD domain-containing protein [Solirubrobacteraceae bacterium]
MSAALLAVAAAGGVLSAAQPAYARADWVLPSTTLSPAGPIGWPPVVAADAAGGATAVYATEKSYGAGSETLLSADHSAGGEWGQPATVPSGGNAGQIALATGADGDLTAVWVDSTDGNSFSVWTAERPAGGVWSSAAQLPFTGQASDTVNSPGVAEAPQGDAVAAWTETDRQHSMEWLVASQRHAGTWGAPVRLSGLTARVLEGAPIQVAVDERGDFVVAWSQFTAQTSIYAVQSQQLIGSAWQGEQTIESSGDGVSPVALGGNASGDTTAVWADVQQQSVRSAILRNGVWTAAGAGGGYSPAICQAPLPQLGVDGAANTTAAWVLTSGQVGVRTMTADGAWVGSTQTLSRLPAGDVAYHPQIAVDPAGDASVSWSYYDGPARATFIQVASRSAGGVWGAPVTLSGPDPSDTATSLAQDAQGNAVQVWASSQDSYNYEIDAAGFEGAPVVRELTVPAQMSTRRAAAFTAAPVAPWATVTSVHWDFGDGAHADQAQTTHVYTRAGVYKVTLTVTDSLFNQATVARRLTVTVTATPQAPLVPAGENQASNQAASGDSTAGGGSSGLASGGSGSSGLASGGSGSTGLTSGGSGADSTGSAGANARLLPTLAPVYVVAPRQRLWLARGARTMIVTVRNTNVFRVTGTASIVDSSQAAPMSAAAAARALPLASWRFRLGAHTKGRVYFRLSAGALRRVRAQVLSRGHSLVRVRLAIKGAAGQTASGASTYALDTPPLVRHGQQQPVTVQPSFAAPTSPWAHGDC